MLLWLWLPRSMLLHVPLPLPLLLHQPLLLHHPLPLLLQHPLPLPLPLPLSLPLFLRNRMVAPGGVRVVVRAGVGRLSEGVSRVHSDLLRP